MMGKTKHSTDLSKKLAFYDLQGKRKERVIFRVGIPQCMWTDKNKSYGDIKLYDDMTEKDVLSNYRYYKKQRIDYLRGCGIKIRKYITKNALRDYGWHKIVASYGNQPNYKQIAKEWAKSNKKEVVRMLLRHLWNAPDECMSRDLEGAIGAHKAKGDTFTTFLTEVTSNQTRHNLASDLTHYIDYNIPRLIRSASHRYKKSL